MSKLHETITQLTNPQVNALLDAIGNSFQSTTTILAEAQRASVLNLVNSKDGDFARLLLHILIEKDIEIRNFVELQIINNQQYLFNIREGENYRSGGEMIFAIIGLITALGIKIDWQVEHGRLKKIEIATGLLAIPIISQLYKKLKVTIDKGDIIIQNNRETNYYGTIDKVFQIENNLGDFNFFNNDQQDKILTEIEHLKNQLTLTKSEILEGIQTNNLQLEKSLCIAFQKMSTKDLAVVEKGLEDINQISKRNAEILINSIIPALNKIEKEFKIGANELKALLVSKEKISKKLRIAIPFLPFVSVLYEYDANNPLNKWWHKLKNTLL